MVRLKEQIRLIDELRDCLRARTLLEEARNIGLITPEEYNTNFTLLNDKFHSLLALYIAEEPDTAP